jgi:O-antigen/teichoic acid export membrane protein
MNQSRLGSLIEAVFNTALGLAISVIANALVFPLFGFHPSLGENVAISLIYTVISIARQYVVRRWFNARLHLAAATLAGTVWNAQPPWHTTEHEGADPD